ncbi:hypothetical protein M436DRAFT_82071 [Aureobasidium namibiae CBS 147.97]|uniref:Uncharacterized protein n=1 Tax=Aureobasidium namibiae CBS 147.97 TaxID=1043004 RepID=A0A074WSP8_9PEZI|nr:uncharacterized protein M436DRAFT_82071 [Aureobasidium namibiae CBS 147.97]KEQ72792.1 hypothetical protein M436DRAFT_82071 [Aureobasidium namibiae CBS 147.97]
MAPPTKNHINYSRPFDLSRSGHSDNTSSTQDNKMELSTNNQTNTASSLAHNKNHENTSKTMANQTNKGPIIVSSSNHSNQIASYPPLHQMNNFHITSTLPRQSHHSITPTPLRQNTTAASLSQFDSGSGGSIASPNTPLIQHKTNTTFSYQTNHDGPSSSLHRTGGEGIGGSGNAGVSSSQHFKPANPTPYPAINSAWNQNIIVGNHNLKSHLPSQSTDKPTRQARSNPSSPQNMDQGNHRSIPTPITNRIPNTHAKNHSSLTDLPKKSTKPSRPTVDPRYDPNLTLAQRLEASTELPLAPFSGYEWKSENEYVNMTSWQPPDRHSEGWRQRDSEG